MVDGRAKSVGGTKSISAQATVGGPGSRVVTTYLDRHQEFVSVNKNDLEDIREFDGMQTTFATLGMFLFGGAFWLGAEKLSEQEVFSFTPMILFCFVCVSLGAILFFISWRVRVRKIGRITRIFRETAPSSITPASL